ncbi:MAG: tetratricopeptide repeat protein [Bacteroidales bacterium]|nr:tetratricopeptide repeat protein [Bacteroidales bacterium]
MQEGNFQGNEVALSMACNAFEDVLEGRNKALFISGAKGVGKSALIKRLRERLSSPETLERFGFLTGKQLEQGFIHFVDDGDVSSLPQDCYAVITIDEIQDCNDSQLCEIRELVKSLASSCLHYMLVLAYTSGSIVTQSTMLMPTIAEAKDILAKASISYSDIEVKPMTLADIATTIAFTMSPNNFPSNFVNRLYALSGGVQLYIRETFSYLRESGALSYTDGKWMLNDDIAASIFNPPITIGNLEALRINLLAKTVDDNHLSDSTLAPRLLQLCRNHAKHHIIDEQQVATLARIAPAIAAAANDDTLARTVNALLPKEHTTQERSTALIINPDNISNAGELLEDLAKHYHMTQLLQNTQYMLDSLPESDYRNRRIALRYKCDAQIFIGMYQDAYQTATQLYESASIDDDHTTRHQALYLQGYAAGLLQDFDTSDRCLQEAVETIEKYDPNNLADRRKYLCIHASLQNDHPNPKEALRIANEAYELAERDNDKKTECQALIVIAQAHKALFDMDRAKVESMLALKIIKEIDDPRLEARAHASLASYYQSNHENDKAAEQYLIAEKLMMKINDTPGMAGIHINFGNLLCDSSDYDDAIKHFEDALAATKSLNILSKMLGAYIGLGTANIYKGNITQAERHLVEAMETADKIGSYWALAYANASMGEYHQQIGECEEALVFYKKALEIDRKNEDDINEYCDLINIASMCSYTDRIEEGIQTLQKAQEMPVDRIKDSMGGNVNNTFAGLYYAKGDYEMALSYYQKALEQDIKSNHQINTSISYGNISGTYFALNDLDNAVKMADKAIAIDRQLNDSLQLANHLSRQAANYQAQNKLTESRDMFLESAKLFHKLNILDDEAMMLRNAAANMHDLEDNTAAAKTLRGALSALEESGNYELQPGIIKLLALLASEKEQYDEAINLYKKAAAIYTEHQLELDENYGDIYQSMADLYLENDRNTDAIQCYQHLAKVFAESDPDFCVENHILAGKTYIQIPDEQGAIKEFDIAYGMLDNMKEKDARAAAKSDIGDYLCWRKIYDQGIAFKTKAINDIKDTTENKQLLARLYYTLAEHQLDQKNPTDALENYFAALRIYQDTNDYWQQAFILNNIGYAYDTIGQMKTASQFYHRAYNCYKETNDLDGMYNNLNNEALMLEKIGHHDEAAACYRSALDLLQKEQADPANIARAAINIAKNLMNIVSDDAVKYFNLAYTNFKEEDMLDEMLSCLDLLTMHYINKQNIPSAKSCINIAQTLLNSRHAYEAQAKIYNLIGCIYTYIWEPANAIEAFYKSLRILAEHDQWNKMAHCHFLMATKLMHNEEHLTDIIEIKGKSGKISDFCMEFLDFAVKTADKEGDKQLLSDAIGTRSLLYWNKQQYDLYEADMSIAIEKATTEVARLSLMLHSGVLDMMLKNYDRAEQKFIETYQAALQEKLLEEQIIAKAWLCCLYFEKSDLQRATTILNELHPYLEYAIAKVPGLGAHLAKI